MSSSSVISQERQERFMDWLDTAISQMSSSSVTSQERQEWFIDRLDTNEFSPFAIDMLKNFLKPTVACNIVEVGVGLAIGNAVAVNAGLGDCIGSNGRRWVRKFVGIGVGVGVGATVEGSIGTCEAKEYAVDHFSAIKSLKVSLAALYGVAVERQLGVHVNLIEVDQIGLAVGAGGYIVETKKFNKKMFFLGTDEEYLFDKFQNFK